MKKATPPEIELQNTPSGSAPLLDQQLATSQFETPTRKRASSHESSADSENETLISDKRKRYTKKRRLDKSFEFGELRSLLCKLCKKVNKTERALKEIKRNVNQAK